MPINGSQINASIINETAVSSASDMGFGTLLTISQSVGLISSGDLLKFKQTVTQYYTGAGDLLSFTQSVSSIGSSGNLLYLIQAVSQTSTTPYIPYIPHNPSNDNNPYFPPPPTAPIPPYIYRNGFYPMYTIGSFIWPDTTIHDVFAITHNESDDKLLTFKLLLRKYTAFGVIDFESFDGAPVKLDIYYLSGVVDRIFTGYINKVDLDLINGTITCSCTADRRNLILNTYALQTNNIGYYDEDVLGQVSDTFDNLEKRLTTVPQTVDVDRFGSLQLSNLLPANSPHFTFTDNQVYGNNDQKPDPKVEKLLRSRVVNTINIKVEYQYQRRYHGNATYSWDWDTDTCEFLVDGLSLCRRDTIENAAKSIGWVLNDNPALEDGEKIRYEPPPASGLYNCPGVGVPIPFTTTHVSGVTFTNITDKDGNPVNGTDGQPLKKATGGTFEDNRNLLATQADWKMSYRWTQNVKETYTLTLTAPQSVAKYGVVQQSDQTSVDDSADNGDWEKYTTYISPGDEMSHEEDSDIYYLDNTPNRAKLYNAMNICLNKAKTSIIKAHRDNRVTFCIPLNSSIEMYHTVYLNCSRIQALGKVIAINHACDVNNGNAFTTLTIALTRSIGSASDSALSPPQKPTQIPPDPQWLINMGSIYGEEPSAKFKGFVGNKWVETPTFQDAQDGRGSNLEKTKINERFIAKAPDIGKEYRDLLALSGSGTYTMSIPNYTFTVSFL
jgi:hypothetical protein